MTKKRRKRHSPEQIVKKLRDAMLNAGKDLAAALQALEVSEATFHRWRNQYGGMKSEEAKRLKQLDEENKRLKEIVAEKELGYSDAEAHRGGTLVSPSLKRSAVKELQSSLKVSERRACKVLAQPRSSHRYAAQRLEQLLSTITNWDLFLAFLIIDGCTPGKSRKSLVWFFDLVLERVDSRVTTDWLI